MIGSVVNDMVKKSSMRGGLAQIRIARGIPKRAADLFDDGHHAIRPTVQLHDTI
jgi:hypothetical protein